MTKHVSLVLDESEALAVSHAIVMLAAIAKNASPQLLAEISAAVVLAMGAGAYTVETLNSLTHKCNTIADTYINSPRQEG